MPGPRDKGIAGRDMAKDKNEGKQQKLRGQLLDSTSKKGTKSAYVSTYKSQGTASE